MAANRRRISAAIGFLVGEVDERASRVRKTQRERHRIAAADPVVPGIGVDLQDSGEAVEMLDRTAALAVRRIDIGHRRRRRAAPWSVVACIGPQLSGLGPSGLRRRDHRHHRLVGEQLGRALELGHQMRMDRRQPPGGAADPVGEHRALDVDALAGIDAGLTVERAVIGIFRDHHLGDQRIGRDALVDHEARRRRLDHAGLVAAATAIAWTPGDEHAELDGDNVEALADILADHVKVAIAAGADLALDVDDLFDPLQMRRQRTKVLPAPLALLSVPGLVERCLDLGLCARQRDLEILERQLELIGIELLAARPELPTLEQGEDLGDALDLVVSGGERLIANWFWTSAISVSIPARKSIGLA